MDRQAGQSGSVSRVRLFRGLKIIFVIAIGVFFVLIVMLHRATHIIISSASKIISFVLDEV